MAISDEQTVVSNYPRGHMVDPIHDIGVARRLVAAYYSCNAAVVYPMVLGIALAFAASVLFPTVSWFILPVFVCTPFLAGVLIRPAIDAYAEVRSLETWQRWFYLITISVLTPFCIGCLWTARLQSLIQRELKVLGLEPKFTRRGMENMLNLIERNQRLEPLPVAISEERG